MADATKATSKATEAAGGLASDALRDAGQRLIGLLVQRVTDAAIERVDNLSDRLTDVAENGAPLVRRRSRDEGDDEDGEPKAGLMSRLGSAVGGIGEKVKEAFGGGGGGGTGKKLKVTNIVESMDVGLPLRATYDLWTQFGDFPSFMKKVETVDQESDEKTNWKAQIWWSHRTWESTIIEQVPDSHVVWRSKGQKGHVDGAVTFTALGPNLTRVLVVLEYWPKGLFEYTGNLWRAQGRRARLELKHFRRHAMTQVILRQDEIEGWRGEIRDSEVVRTHEEALAEEEQARPPEEEAASATAEQAEGEEAEPAAAAPEQAEEPEEDTGAAEYDEEYDEEEAPEGEEAAYDEDEEEAPEGEEAAYDEDEEEAPEGEEAAYDEDEEAADEDYEDYDEDEEYEPAEEARAAEDEEPAEEEPAGDGRARRREPVGARGRRGR